MNYTDILSECIQVSIYLGNTCNFDCNYCDRSYISNAIGNQAMNRSNIDHLENFFEQIYKESDLKLQQIAFHGGEPFLFVKRMDQIIERKLGELNEADIGSSKDILDILQFAHKLRMDELAAQTKLEAARASNVKQQTNIQINSPFGDTNYGKLLDSLLNADDKS